MDRYLTRRVVPSLWLALAPAACTPAGPAPGGGGSTSSTASSGDSETGTPTDGGADITGDGEDCTTTCTPPAVVWCRDDLESETYVDIAVGPGGEIVVVTGSFLFGRVYLWNSDGTLGWMDELEGPAAAVMFRDDSSFLVFAEAGGYSGDVGYTTSALYLYGTDGELMNEWRANPEQRPAPALARHPDGGYVVAGNGYYGVAWISRLDGDLEELWENSDAGDLGFVRGLATGPDGRLFLATSPARLFSLADDGSPGFLWMSEQAALTLAGLQRDPSQGLLAHGGPEGGDWRAGVDPDTGAWTLTNPWPQVSMQLTELELLEPGATDLGATAAAASESGRRLRLLDDQGASRFAIDLPSGATGEGGIQAIARDAPGGRLVAGGTHYPTPDGPPVNWLCSLEL